MDTFNISNRRYLGNKYKLSGWIREVVEKNCNEVNSFFDVFAGTGSVASAFLDKRLVVCDMMFCNYLAALCWFSPQNVDRAKVSELLDYYNAYDASAESNYMSQNFANTYFDTYNSQKIGFIREDIESKFLAHKVNDRERAMVVTSLIYAMDRISHTCGHYDSFIRDGKYEGELILRMPDNGYELNLNNHVYCADSNMIASDESVDVAYLDPPYNSRLYCEAYHLLENVARWEKPHVFGIAEKMDRTQMKSNYCKSVEAAKALRDLVLKLNSRYILLSYNNNGKKLQCRSNAKMTDEEIIEAAKKAHAHKFIIQLKGGYDAMLAEEGSNLSQGQRQLLSIARIMLANPPMLILDEATSSIDTRTERQIQDAFDTMMIGRTTFIVAHRLSTIQKADQIIVMNDGHIIEQGKHEELLKKNGFYHNLYYSQFEKPE